MYLLLEGDNYKTFEDDYFELACIYAHSFTPQENYLDLATDNDINYKNPLFIPLRKHYGVKFLQYKLIDAL